MAFDNKKYNQEYHKRFKKRISIDLNLDEYKELEELIKKSKSTKVSVFRLGIKQLKKELDK